VGHWTEQEARGEVNRFMVEFLHSIDDAKDAPSKIGGLTGAPGESQRRPLTPLHTTHATGPVRPFGSKGPSKIDPGSRWQPENRLGVSIARLGPIAPKGHLPQAWRASPRSRDRGVLEVAGGGKGCVIRLMAILDWPRGSLGEEALLAAHGHGR
jgi:hypothetical protein